MRQELMEPQNHDAALVEHSDPRHQEMQEHSPGDWELLAPYLKVQKLQQHQLPRHLRPQPLY
jgi:hypothetical protein